MSGSNFFKTHITLRTSTLTLLLAGCISIAKIVPQIDSLIAEQSPPVGTVAGLSIGGTIEPTPTNTLYAELQTKRAELDKKEASLEAERRYLEESRDDKTAILYIVIAILGVLVIINFYYDIKRYRATFKQEQHT